MSRPWLVRIALAAIALVLAFLFFRPSVHEVDVGSARRAPLTVTVDEEGETRVRDRFVVAAPVAGRIERIALKAGASVDAWTILARIYPLQLDPRARAEASAKLDAAEAAQRESEARVEQAEAALQQATRSAKRARQLARPGTISAEELELAELAETTRTKELEAARFAATVAAHNVAAAKAALLSPGLPGAAPGCGDGTAPCIEIKAPVSGRILRVLEESERVVPVGSPLVEIGDPARLEIVIDVLSADAVKIQPGARVIIEDWGGDHPLMARVRLVEPSGFTKLSALGVEEQRVNVIADFVDAPATLADGYRLEARIVVWESPDVLQVPTSALFRRGGAWSVFVVHRGRAERREVQIGHRSATDAEVLGGLTVGDVVILHPSDLIEDGVRVHESPL
jgi:HlyD family secretion protein